MIRIIFIAFCLLFISYSLASGQIATSTSGNPEPKTQKDYDNQIRSIQERQSDITKKTIPKNDLAITRELDRLDMEIQSISNDQTTVSHNDENKKRVDLIFGNIIQARTALADSDCSNGLSKYRQDLQDYTFAANTLKGGLAWMGDINFQLLFPAYDHTSEMNACNSLKSEFNDPVTIKNIDGMLAEIQKRIAYVNGNEEKILGEENILLQSLKKHRSELQDALSSESSQQKISANLPLILGIIGASCVLAIVSIKLFDARIQMEWVVSGQVIQFVTVMVLLSVITALALSDILKETTLGTLLGGIAGYVLAQGVGRATARDVSRRLEASNPNENGKPPLTRPRFRARNQLPVATQAAPPTGPLNPA